MLEAVPPTIVVLAFLVAIPTIFEIVKSRRLYARRDRFKCRMCGNCCRFRVTPVTAEDIKRLSEAGCTDFLSTHGDSLKRVNGRCVFLNQDSCTIHEFRPKVCREFPFFRIYGIGYCSQASFCPAVEELENG